jgi:hypothetical protein
MAAKIYLRVIDEAEEGKDSILVAGVLPMFKGSEDENLACGSCKQVLCRNVSTRTLYERFSASGRLVLRCICGAFNLAPTQRLAEPD